MRTLTKVTLGGLALVALLGVGLVSAHGGFAGGPGGARGLGPDACSDDITVGECRARMGDPCNDAMTVGDCKAAHEAKRADMEAQRKADCLERNADREDAEAFCSQPPPHARGPGGPGGPGFGHGRPPRGNATAPPA